MSTQRVLIGFALSAAAAVLAPVRADQPVNLGVKMGLWQVTTRAQVNGAIPPELAGKLQSMPPAQRARIEAAMQAAMADAQREHVFKKCMTPKKLSEGLDTGNDSAGCKSTLVSNTRTDFEYDKVCAPQNGQDHTEKAQFHLLDSHHIAGKVDVHTGGPHPMTVHEDIKGKWLSSSCGSVKDTETVR
ncbi:MAG TPA: DUF3617 family protein [Steroidobacteraceae bacterium]|nr:DUF3617 family protein [Steroidobacteraceae bacterium]